MVCSGCSTRYAQGLEACPHCGSLERLEEGSPSGSRLPFLEVCCIAAICRAKGTLRRVMLRSPAPGVVELPSLCCTGCGGMLVPVAGWPWPGEEESMPKITVHSGASNAAAEREHQLGEPSDGVEVPADGSESPEITGDGSGQALPPADDSMGEEESSPGNSSEASSEKPPTSEQQSATELPKRARTTASRSKKARAESSTADSTDTSGPETADEES